MNLIEQILLNGKLKSSTQWENIPLELVNSRYRVKLAVEKTVDGLFAVFGGTPQYVLKPTLIHLKDRRALLPDFIKSIIIQGDRYAISAPADDGWHKFVSKGAMMKSELKVFKLQKLRYVCKMEGVECRLKVIPSPSKKVIKFTAVTLVDKSKVRLEDTPYISRNDLQEDITCRSFKPNFIATTLYAGEKI